MKNKYSMVLHIVVTRRICIYIITKNFSRKPHPLIMTSYLSFPGGVTTLEEKLAVQLRSIDTFSEPASYQFVIWAKFYSELDLAAEVIKIP